MVDPKIKQKGIVLVLVLATILIVVLLGIAVLNIISSQSRLTHHQLSRIQAYYANRAAINYAIERLRIGGPPAVGGWVAGTNCQFGSPCTESDVGLNLAGVNGDFKSPALTGISLIIRADSDPACLSPGVAACISCTATYTHTEP